jgi:flagellar protein FliO/FliZ
MMIGAALLIPVGLWATQITISEVNAEREGGRVAITIKGDAMIDPEAASAKLGDGRLYLYVQDARVREANRSWENGVGEDAEEIRAHRHRLKVELSIPLGDGGCQGPVEFEKTPVGLRALVACDGAPRATAPRQARMAAANPQGKPDASLEITPRIKLGVTANRVSVPTPAPSLAPSAGLQVRVDTNSAVRVPMPASEAAALRAKLALDPPPAEEDGQEAPVRPTAAAAAIAAAPAVAATPAAPILAAPAASLVATKPPAGTAQPVPVAKAPVVVEPGAELGARAGAATPGAAASGSKVPPAISTGAPAGAGAGAAVVASFSPPAVTPAPGGAGGNSGPLLGGLALVAIAAAAFIFARKRRVANRHIEILETASLGPKRALIVARIGGTRMVLGSSEAGITLIQSLSDPGAPLGEGVPLWEPTPEALLDGLPEVPVGSAPDISSDNVSDSPRGGYADSPSGVSSIADDPADDPVEELADELADEAAFAPMFVPASERPATRARAERKIEVEEPAASAARVSFDAGEARSVGQAGLLARLFHRHPPANDAALPRFEDLLEDSFEDQELRRKLSLGLPGRVR